MGIKEFSRPEGENTVREFDLNRCVDRALLMSRNETKYIAFIEKDYRGTLPLEGNENQLVQVLINLILNAAYAIKGGKSDKLGLIRVRTFLDREFAYCEISDDGIGIPNEHLESIFDPFFTTKPFEHGVGLGLSIVHDIVVHKHNGNIEVESMPEKGSKFTIRLPLKQQLD